MIITFDLFVALHGGEGKDKVALRGGEGKDKVALHGGEGKDKRTLYGGESNDTDDMASWTRQWDRIQTILSNPLGDALQRKSKRDGHPGVL